MGAIEDLQNMMNRDALQYPFDRLQTTAILNLAARMDEAVKKIYELELASPCPLLKSICEGWEFTVKLDKEEIIERYAGEIHTIRALDSVQLDTVKQLLSDLIDEVTR